MSINVAIGLICLVITVLFFFGIYKDNEEIRQSELEELQLKRWEKREHRKLLNKIRNRKLTVVLKVKSSMVECPLCWETIDGGIACDGCGTFHHLECLMDMSGGQCAIIGCRRRIGESS